MNILHCSRNTLNRVSPSHSKQKYDSLRHQNRSLIFWSKMIFPSWFPTFLFSWMTAAAAESNQGWVSAELWILDTHHIHRLRWAKLPRGRASPTKPNQTHLPLVLIHICQVFRVRVGVHQEDKDWKATRSLRIVFQDSMGQTIEFLSMIAWVDGDGRLSS